MSFSNKKYLFGKVLFLLSLFEVFLPKRVFAQVSWPALIQASTPSLGSSFTIGTLLNQLLRYFIPLSGMVLLLFLIYGGYKIMFSGGQPAKISEGKDIIVGALIGFTIIFVAYFLIQLVGIIFGISIFSTIFHP